MNQYNLIEPASTEIFRLDSLLKVMRIAAFEQAERPKDSLPTEDFPGLFDIALDRLNLIKEYVDELESTIGTLLEGKRLEEGQRPRGPKPPASK